jgi:tRNA pseudouridine65 synthase
MSEHLKILFQDESYVAIDKPAGMLVHKTTWAAAEKVHCMGLLRDQLGRWVYPVHRLDRSTSGVLVFALNPAAAEAMNLQFRLKAVRKTYFAIVRGHPLDHGRVDKPLTSGKSGVDGETSKPSLSLYWTVDRMEIPVPLGRYASARYALVRIEAQTGRTHQVRRHMKSISHPLIGDTVYGDGKHNRFFREHFESHRLLLGAQSLALKHPGTGAPLEIHASWPEEFSRVFPDWHPSKV